MKHQIEQQIRERAYHLWIGAGMADGCDREHWMTAEREILATSDDKGAVVAPKRRKSAPAKATTAKAAKAKKITN